MQRTRRCRRRRIDGEAYAALRAGARLVARLPGRSRRDRAEGAGQRPGRGARRSRPPIRSRGCRSTPSARLVGGVAGCAHSGCGPCGRPTTPSWPPSWRSCGVSGRSCRRPCSTGEIPASSGRGKRCSRSRSGTGPVARPGSPRRRPGPARTPSSRRFSAIARLVAYFEVDGVLHAVTVVGRPRAPARARPRGRGRGRSSMPFASACGASRRRRRRALRASRHSARPTTRWRGSTSSSCDRSPGRSASRPLVIVPTGTLHAMPWSIISSLAGRPVTVAPSASAWADARERRPRPWGRRVHACWWQQVPGFRSPRRRPTQWRCSTAAGRRSPGRRRRRPPCSRLSAARTSRTLRRTAPSARTTRSSPRSSSSTAR